MLDSFQSRLVERGADSRREIIAYFEALARAEGSDASARDKLLERLYDGAPFETVAIEYLENVNRAARQRTAAREKLLARLKQKIVAPE